jgi:hypothetical protein
MRHCFNDDVQVYEESNKDLSELLHSVAEFASKQKATSFIHLNVDYDTGEEGGYRANLYVHE